MKLILALIAALLLPVAAFAQPASYGDNVKAWLAAIDAGHYDASWDMASDYFKSKVTKEQWTALAKPVRDMVGDPVSRGAAQVIKTDTLPDAPFGHYLVITIHTKFSMNPSATETIIMKLENGEWKVAGYFIK
jgi:serine/threonine-protein kinase